MIIQCRDFSQIAAVKNNLVIPDKHHYGKWDPA